MDNKPFASRLTAWLARLPIADAIEYRMAELLQIMLLGLMSIFALAGVLNFILTAEVVSWQTTLFTTLTSILIIGIPLVLLRRGRFRLTVFLLILMLLFTETCVVLLADLRSVAETLSFFTLAIILAGSLLSRRALLVTFLLSAAAVLAAAFQESGSTFRQDAIVIAGNFILLHGLISLFLDRFGVTLRSTLKASMERESHLQSEISVRKRAEAALQHSTEQLEILHQIDRSLLMARSLREIAVDTLVRIRKLIPCIRASITLFDLAKQEASFLAADFHKPVTFPDTPISFEDFGQRIIDKLQANQAWVVDDVLADPQATELDKRLAYDSGVYAWLSVPLLVQGQLIGALNLGRGSGPPFSKPDTEVACDVANQLAIALQQTNLYNSLQNELAARKKLIVQLETINAELERFTYSVSHDLRNPLVTIKGFIGMLRNDLREGRKEKADDDIERIENAADKMQALLADLLELSRVGRIMNPPEEVQLAQIVKEAIESLDARLRSKNVVIHSSLDLPNVRGDRVRLREVFENLIDNAVKYSGGRTDPMIEIGSRSGQGEIVLFVKDNGIGVEPQFQKRIFGLFEKLDPASEGTGIGLALIKRIIEVHGGRIWVESEGNGTGSMFCFTIPDGIAKDSE